MVTKDFGFGLKETTKIFIQSTFQVQTKCQNWMPFQIQKREKMRITKSGATK